MTWRAVLDVFDALDDPNANGASIADLLRARGASDVEVTTVAGRSASTDFVRLAIPGHSGRSAGGRAPTLGLIGRLGGVGARPEQVGLVSDGDGAVAVLAAGAKLVAMHARGDILAGDVIVATHVCPVAPTEAHEPVPFMNSPVDMATKNLLEVDAEMDAIVSVDTTRGNRVVNHRGIAMSPPVCQGYILRVAEPLLSVAERVTGGPAVVLPLTTQDITPYGNGVYHLNSILQPATATPAPVVGLAITAETVVAGSATGASDLTAVEVAARFCVEVAKDFTAGRASFVDRDELSRLQGRYGSMTVLQTMGETVKGGSAQR
jgi:hypothetical protein